MTGTAERVEPAAARDFAALLSRRFELGIEVPRQFFQANAESISRACFAMARRFEQGGRLLVFGEGAQASDAGHVAVEFVHPVLVGKRALPAIALPGDAASILARLATLSRPQDIAMAIDIDGRSLSALAGLELARSRDLLTIALTGGDGGVMRRERAAAHLFVVETDDPMAIQEVHETLYHVLWELVHLFFEQRVAR